MMADRSALRGYDSFTVSLGDEMRGRRATLGRSLLDVQRDLRIRASHVEAIENADPQGIPYNGFVTGYVRAYARYLGMDEDDTLRRFCLEAGYTPTSGPHAKSRSGPKALSAAIATPRADLDALIAGSRLAAVSRAEALAADLGSTLRAVSSVAVLALLIGGVGYVGWAVLRNIQQVEFAPSPEAPAALAQGPELAPDAAVARASLGPAPAVDAQALAAIYAAQDVAPLRQVSRDGPISALDPARSGVYAALPAAAEPAPAPAPAEAASAGAAVGTDVVAAVAPAPAEPAAPPAGAEAEAEDVAPAPAEASASPSQAAVEAGEETAQTFALVFEGEVWLRVRDGSGRVIHETLAPAGGRWTPPSDLEGLTLRAGNAGSLYAEIDGARFGPFGRPGQVVTEVSLEPGILRSRLPRDAGPEVAEAASGR